MNIPYGLVREGLKKIYLILDYIFWLIFDFSKFKKIKKERIKKVLLIHQGVVGELIVTTPVIKALKDNFNCDISYMVNPGKEPLFINNPYISEVLTFDENNFKKNLETIRSKNFDLTILFQAHFKLAKMCWKAGIPYRIGGFSGFKRSPSIFFTRRFFPIVRKNTVLKNLELAEIVGAKNINPKIEVFSSKNDDLKIKKFLRKNKIEEFIIVHPGFGDWEKKNANYRLWPVKKYSEFINSIIKNSKFKVILGIGKISEKPLTSRILEHVWFKNKVIECSGLFDLAELISLIKHSKLVLAPDTGISHITSALGIPLINLINSENLKEWAPWGDSKKIININKHLGYQITFFPPKITFSEGIKSISVEEVLKAYNFLLKNEKKH
ncbi:MAG: glycosyltransferase family 9 protein [Candidatus Omnitrophica bacterium]|nr:glycosyltransferase family 9 protein [Candidatus Omnitrophota bacterium]